MKRKWRCFHCDGLFSSVRTAREHFGDWPADTPACVMSAAEGGLLGRVRKAEELLDRYRSEDSDKDRQMAAMVADQASALTRAMDRGYDRGVAGVMAELREQLDGIDKFGSDADYEALGAKVYRMLRGTSDASSR